MWRERTGPVVRENAANFERTDQQERQHRFGIRHQKVVLQFSFCDRLLFRTWRSVEKPNAYYSNFLFPREKNLGFDSSFSRKHF